jgi:aspartokinase
MMRETQFEKPRGVSDVEVRHGYSQVHVSRLDGDVMQARLAVLSAVANAGVSIDFLKLTRSGLSFLVDEASSDKVAEALDPLGRRFSVRRDRSIVLVHAVNMRDEEGLIAGIVRDTIATGASIDHIGDMHNRMLLVMPREHVDQVAERLRSGTVAAAE